jgi:hypothetical protein
METPAQTEPKKSNTGLMVGIGIAVFLVLCCCCLVVIGAVSFGMLPLVRSGPSSFPTPAFDFDFETPDADSFNAPSSNQFVPEGGRGDLLLRTDTWGFVMIASSAFDCSDNPSAADTTITITQQPDALGIWEEEWTVTCDNGSKKAFDVTFTPSEGGGTDISVKAGN